MAVGRPSRLVLELVRLQDVTQGHSGLPVAYHEMSDQQHHGLEVVKAIDGCSWAYPD